MPQTTGRPANFDELDFFELATLGKHVSYRVPQSFASLSHDCDAIVVGRFVGIVPGRTYGSPDPEWPPTQVSVAEIAVDEGLTLGTTERHVYVELTHGPVVDASSLMKKMPVDRYAFFLLRADRYPSSAVRMDRVGVPDGSPLYLIHLPLGIVAEEGEMLTFPLEAEEENWIASSLSSLEDVLKAAADGFRNQ